MNNRKLFATLIATSWSYSTLQEVKWGWYEPQLHIVRWCNGSTTVFGSVCFGSSPGLTTIQEWRNVL